MIMQKDLIRKGLALAAIVLFVGMFISPSISGNVKV